MITLKDGTKTAEVIVKLNGKDHTLEFLKEQGIIITDNQNTVTIPNIDDIVNAMIEFEDKDPDNWDFGVTFLV